MFGTIIPNQIQIKQNFFFLILSNIMKKVGSPSKLKHHAHSLTSAQINNKTPYKEVTSAQPVKLGNYIRNRQENNKTLILERIKSNPVLINYEDPAIKTTRQKKQSILKNIDQLMSLLDQRKNQLDTKAFDDLIKHEEEIKKMLYIFTSTEIVCDQQKKIPNISKAKCRKHPSIMESSVQLFSDSILATTMPDKIISSSYLNKTEYLPQSCKSSNSRRFQKIPNLSFSNFIGQDQNSSFSNKSFCNMYQERIV